MDKKILAKIIVERLKVNSSLLINIQIEEEQSQYDVLFSYNFLNQGYHQRGIRANDLLIGIVGGSVFGFDIGNHETDSGYYEEKLHIGSEYLTDLFNEVRKQLKE